MSEDIRLSLIAAVAQNGIIGVDNKLPWHLPDDLKYFKAITLGKPVIMGRATFESLKKPLPGRTNIVVSRNPEYAVPEGVRLVHDLDSALRIARAQCHIDGQEEMIVMGGGQLYTLALPQADRLYLTEVHRDFAGDAKFPEFDREAFNEVSRETRHAESLGLDYSYVVLDRKLQH